MTTFDLAEVGEFAADLTARIERCDNGEGMECATLDDALRHCAKLCCEYREGVRGWGRAVFTGRVPFDPRVQKVWLDAGVELYNRAVEMQASGLRAEVPCYELDGRAALDAALWNLNQLLWNWVTPRLAVGPAARQPIDLPEPVAEEVRRRITALPPLPAGWSPPTKLQQRQLNRLRRKWNP